MSKKTLRYPVYTIKVADLVTAHSLRDPWCCGFKLEMLDRIDEVPREVEQWAHRRYDDLWDQYHEYIHEPWWHVARIHWLLEHPKSLAYPITLQETRLHSSGITITEGWHRLFGHVYAKLTKIRCTYDGNVAIINEMAISRKYFTVQI